MIKVYNTFDFEAVSKRVEKTKIDPYQVHAEDFENINDLIERSIRTKTQFKEDKIPGLVYDTEKEIADFLGNGEPTQSQAGEVSDQDKQSEVQTDTQPAQDLQAKP